MIHFVLHARGEQPVGFEYLRVAVLVEIAYADRVRTFDLGKMIGQAEAAFFGQLEFVRRPDNFRIDQFNWLRIFVLARHVANDYAAGIADLGRRQPDPRHSIHGLQHIAHEVAHGLVDRLDRAAFDLKARIGRKDDGQQGHRRRSLSNKPCKTLSCRRYL